MSSLNEIVEKFPVRKKPEQKAAFRAWAVEQAQSLGYQARVEKNGRHQNIVVGNPETAEVTFTAHYDTPAVSPFPNIMMPRNIPLFYLYQIVIVAVLFAISGAAVLVVNALTHNRQLVLLTFYIMYFGLLFLMLLGPANKHNVNDNTSGVAAVLSLMEKLPENVRSKAAFILFDNEEKGKQGSKAYAKEHLEVQYTHLVVNMDCVGVGENIIVIAKKLAALQPVYPKLEAALAVQTERKAHFFGAASSVCNSDQASFRCGVVICACKRRPIVGFYTPDIHTKRDTYADEGNIEYVASGMRAFVESI